MTLPASQTEAAHTSQPNIEYPTSITMASSKTQQPVGSTGWIAAEKENIQQLVDQELEEIAYPAQHEMEWLNEHMTEIFSKNQL